MNLCSDKFSLLNKHLYIYMKYVNFKFNIVYLLIKQNNLPTFSVSILLVVDLNVSSEHVKDINIGFNYNNNLHFIQLNSFKFQI